MSRRAEHGDVIRSFLRYLNLTSDNYVLKDGTALMTCYKLDRFSEDIGLDSRQKCGTSLDTIDNIVSAFCDKMGYVFQRNKNTDTVKRFMIHYNREKEQRPLKVEISYREAGLIPDFEIRKINGVSVYSIDALCAMKTIAYERRDALRDLYDLSYICNNYFDELSYDTVSMIREGLIYKGIEYFDYLLATQADKDELIDPDKLLDGFLRMYDKIGLSLSGVETEIIDTLRNRDHSDQDQDPGIYYKEVMSDFKTNERMYVMKYITGLHALNLPCSLLTCGDWHQSALQWKEPFMRNSKDSVFGEYGIETGKTIPEHREKFNVANHIRAILDLLELRKFPLAQGMRDNFICNASYTNEIFQQVLKLRYVPYWEEINGFMGREYYREWLNFIERNVC